MMIQLGCCNLLRHLRSNSCGKNCVCFSCSIVGVKNVLDWTMLKLKEIVCFFSSTRISVELVVLSIVIHVLNNLTLQSWLVKQHFTSRNTLHVPPYLAPPGFLWSPCLKSAWRGSDSSIQRISSPIQLKRFQTVDSRNVVNNWLLWGNFWRKCNVNYSIAIYLYTINKVQEQFEDSPYIVEHVDCLREMSDSTDDMFFC